jgi:hypothetical protein
MTALDGLFMGRIATVVPYVLGSQLAGELRARLDVRGYTPYRLLDRGSYDELRDPDEPELHTALAGLASELTGRALAVVESRALRLRAGDYLLAHHDRSHDDHPVELVLDLSPAAVAGAELHYRRGGQVFFRLASQPGAASIVERGPTVVCNHTYVSKLHADAVVVRLVMLLRDR